MLRVSAEGAADTIVTGLFDGDEPDERFVGTEAKGKFKHLALAHDRSKGPGPSEQVRWLCVGLGERDAFDAERARVVAATVAGRARELDTRALEYRGPEPEAFVEGAILASYRFERFMSEKASEAALEQLIVAGDTQAAQIGAEAQNAARDLANSPPNELTPKRLAGRARELATELGLQCEVLGREQIRYAGMGAFAAVAQGSAEEPQLITLRYAPDDAAGPVLGLVGKAVTFDSGGISIKPGAKMADMKFDMSGGAAVLEAIGAIARLKLPVPVVAVIGATENLPDGAAFKPGDIVRARSGTTIEIINTDAEGRLVLADCLTHAREQGAERIVNVATLTGGIVVALGSTFAGLFANDDEWASSVEAAGARAGERCWRLPLDREYADAIKGAYADIVNATEDRKASSIVAAEFLQRFVADVPWAHLDIAGVAWGNGRAYTGKGGSGFATRTLIELARSMGAPT